jgi:hypothetical protein
MVGSGRVMLLALIQMVMNIIPPLPNDPIAPCPSTGAVKALESHSTTYYLEAMEVWRMFRRFRAISIISHHRQAMVQIQPGFS